MAKKILLIDDNPQDLKIMLRFLSKAGFDNVITASSGEEGVEKAGSTDPDIVISDTVLPGMNGFEVCENIRKSSGRERPKIIIITGAIDAVDAVRAKKLGADDYCAKTSDFVPLIEAVSRLA
jgi:DNA-binding response OmpR family regulator